MNSISPVDLEELKKKYQGESLDIALNRVNEGYPVQYLIGDVNFFGNKILVDENVLIPRYETEFLVELIVKKLGKNFSGNIIEVGTGSGCISISIAKELKDSNIESIDISEEAIKVAQKNIEINNVSNVKLINIDLFKLNNFNNYNVIVSNPPYVSFYESVGEETRYEPQNAIFADDNGLVFYKDIINKVSKSDSVSDIFFEIGMNQAEDIKNYSNSIIPSFNVDTYKDLAGKDRYIHIYLNK